jgi:hypothetical protein
MFCNQCHKNLKDFETLIDKMENCPFCGAKLVRPAVKVPPKGVNDLFDTLLQKVGEGLYEWNSVNKYCAVRGWRVPSKKDFETLIKTAAGLGLGDPSSVLMSRKGWEKCNVTPTDNLGFEATPVKCSTGISNNYFSHFWTAEDKFCFEIFPGRVTFSTHSQSYVRLIKDDIAEPQTPEKK